jgi:hypothetical protein
LGAMSCGGLRFSNQRRKIDSHPINREIHAGTTRLRDEQRSLTIIGERSDQWLAIRYHHSVKC